MGSEVHAAAHNGPTGPQDRTSRCIEFRQTYTETPHGLVMGVLVWLESLPLSVWVHESPSVWALPTVLTLHTMGMAVLVGASWVLDPLLIVVSRKRSLSALRSGFRP